MESYRVRGSYLYVAVQGETIVALYDTSLDRIYPYAPTTCSFEQAALKIKAHLVS